MAIPTAASMPISSKAAISRRILMPPPAHNKLQHVIEEEDSGGDARLSTPIQSQILRMSVSFVFR